MLEQYLEQQKLRAQMPFAQKRAIEVAGELALRCLGVAVLNLPAVDCLDGDKAPDTMQEAFVLLREAAERAGLTPLGALHVMTAGLLAASALQEVFTQTRVHFDSGKGVKPW